MISLIVCTYNREDYIIKCLESIADQTASREDFELVVVNNNSTDSTSNLLLEFEKNKGQQIKHSIYLETDQGLSYARNRGLKEAKGDCFVFIDDDAFLDVDYVKNLLHYFESSKLNDFGFGGKITPFLECELPNWMSKYLIPLMSVIDLGQHTKEFKSSHYPIGANMGFTRKIYEEIGDFNVQLGRVGKNLMGGEEKDLFDRMRNKGYKIIYLPKISVQHVIPKNRLTQEFIQKQALGIGMSERIRTKNKGGGSYLGRWLNELYKWMGSIALFFIYTITGKFAKGRMILRFRSWVSKGLSGGN